MVTIRESHFLRKCLFLLLAGAGMAVTLTGCGEDDEMKTVEKARRELTAKLTLKNGKGQETTTFKLGENIYFCLTVNYDCTQPDYTYTARTWDLLGIVPVEHVFTPMSEEKVDVAEELGSDFREDKWPVAMEVFTADGQFVGYPMDFVYSSKQDMKPGDSLQYECPWLPVDGLTVYSGILGKTVPREPLPAGQYFTCNITASTTTLPVAVSYIKNRVDFTVE